MFEVPTLTTERLILRAHTLDDLQPMTRMWADPAMVRYITGTPSNAEEVWARLLRYIGHWQALGFGYWVVTSRATGEYLGEVGFADFHRAMEPSLSGQAEAGWVLATWFHGLGYAREAVTAMHAWADEHLGHDATVCIMDPEHHASHQVAQHAGYRDSHITTYKGQPTLVMRRCR